MIQVLLLALSLVLTAPAAAANLYVSPTGNDEGNCQSQALPCQTGQYAVNQIRLASHEGWDVFFADGYYLGEINVPHWKVVNLRGNCGNLSAVRLSPSANGTAVITAQDGAIVGVSCLRIDASFTTGNVGLLSSALDRRLQVA